MSVTLLKRDSNTDVFFVYIAKIVRTTFFIEHLRWLLLNCVTLNCQKISLYINSGDNRGRRGRNIYLRGFKTSNGMRRGKSRKCLTKISRDGKGFFYHKRDLSDRKGNRIIQILRNASSPKNSMQIKIHSRRTSYGQI